MDVRCRCATRPMENDGERTGSVATHLLTGTVHQRVRVREIQAILLTALRHSLPAGTDERATKRPERPW
jgi:hypothetical protein